MKKEDVKQIIKDKERIIKQQKIVRK